MSKNLKKILLILLLCTGLNIYVFSDPPGHISGTLKLDESWERNIYISLIDTFEKKFVVSDKMIIAIAPIDSIGQFTIDLADLPTDWCLLRLHVVKKGNPPASLIIGGSDENYCFIVANRHSEIDLRNTKEKPVFKDLIFSGALYMQTIQYINHLSAYSNSLSYEDSLIEKAFIEDVVSEKLKMIADTCQNQLVSLYSLYMTDFLADYENNPTFYSEYLSKWSNNDSPYFQSFRKQIPFSERGSWQYISIVVIVVVIITSSFFYRDRNRRKIKKLSVQERKILVLLQKGASNQEISDAYNIELSTVKSHVSSIFSKLNIKSRKEIIGLKVR